MRIHRLRLENFKLFENQEFCFHPQFNLLVGGNASGKTSVLDGLAVALGVWLVHPPDTSLANSRRNILEREIRVRPLAAGDRVQFAQCRPVRVEAVGDLNSHSNVRWVRQIRGDSARTTNEEATEALNIIRTTFGMGTLDERVSLPVIVNYGAGRAWLPSNARMRPSLHVLEPARRWDAFYACFSERIRVSDLHVWFAREAIAAGIRGGKPRPGFAAVKTAILRCLPDATDLWYDADQDSIVTIINGVPSPFAHLSAGQRMLLAMVGDIAIRAVTQNAHLLPSDELDGDADRLPRLLAETPGVVLIDELDVHLHPRWQRRVQDDLTRTFPAIQFICTTHSPQVIGQTRPECLQFLASEPDEGETSRRASQSFGMDSNWVLENLMHASARDEEIATRLEVIYEWIDAGDLGRARRLADDVERQLGLFPELQGIKSLLDRLELLGEYEAHPEDSPTASSA